MLTDSLFIADLDPSALASVICTRPCLVTQFMKYSSSGGKIYLPAMMIVPPITHFVRDQIAFPIPDIRLKESGADANAEAYLQVMEHRVIKKIFYMGCLKKFFSFYTFHLSKKQPHVWIQDNKTNNFQGIS